MTVSSDKHWSGQWVFLLAAVGYAIGLANIWRFSYVVGENGGGLFVLIYIGCMFLLGLPLMLCDFLIGRRGGGSPPTSMHRTAVASGVSTRWSVIGWIGLAMGFIVLSYYSVIAGWTVSYFFKAIFNDIGATPEQITQSFDLLVADPVSLTFWHALFVGLVALVSGMGLQGGIERFVKYAMPTFFVLLVSLVIFAMIYGDLGAAFNFLLMPRVDQLGSDLLTAALGQAFFSLGVGGGVLMIYGAYVPKDLSLTRAAIYIVTGDTLAALMAGFAIFPLLFGAGLEPGQGPGLVFKSLPLAFAAIPMGNFIGAAFFLLLAFAAFTSAIGLLEPIVSWLEEHKNIKRKITSLTVGGAAGILGIATVFSFNVWSEFFPLGFTNRFATSTIFDVLDFAISNVLLPLNGCLVSIYAGWYLDRKIVREELEVSDARSLWLRTWVFLLKWPIPICLLVLLGNLVFGDAA